MIGYRCIIIYLEEKEVRALKHIIPLRTNPRTVEGEVDVARRDHMQLIYEFRMVLHRPRSLPLSFPSEIYSLLTFRSLF